MNTSAEAYASLRGSINELQLEVYETLATAGIFGLADFELCALLPHLGQSTVRTRRDELVKRGRVSMTGELRKSASGRRCDVFAVVK